MASKEDFDTESGLLTDYTGEVVDAWFAVDEKFGNTQLYLKQTTDSIAVPEITERFSVGGAWKSFDGGKSVENTENPDKTKIHESSRYGQLIRRCSDDLKMIDFFIERGFTPRQSEMWLGLSFQWEQIAKDYTMKEDDGTVKSGTSKYNLPCAFLGGTDGVVAETNGAAPAASGVLDGLSDELVEGLKLARVESPTHAVFVDRAVTLTGVLGNDTLIKAIADETQLWKELS